jgi:type IV secretory pathway TrbF-like protein
VKRVVAKKAVVKPARPVANHAPVRPGSHATHIRRLSAVWEFVAVTGLVLVAGLLALLITF